jgi:hypothetical protein
MALKTLTLARLKDVDGGKPALMFEHDLAVAVRDCRDRPGDKTPRVVTLEIILTPSMDDEGACSDLAVQGRSHARLPKRRTKPYSMGVGVSGELFFNPDSPTNVRQATLLEDDDDSDDDGGDE